jgi:hypothetical protein
MMNIKKIYISKVFVAVCVAITYLILEDSLHTTEKDVCPINNLSKLL